MQGGKEGEKKEKRKEKRETGKEKRELALDTLVFAVQLSFLASPPLFCFPSLFLFVFLFFLSVHPTHGFSAQSTFAPRVPQMVESRQEQRTFVQRTGLFLCTERVLPLLIRTTRPY